MSSHRSPEKACVFNPCGISLHQLGCCLHARNVSFARKKKSKNSFGSTRVQQCGQRGFLQWPVLIPSGRVNRRGLNAQSHWRREGYAGACSDKLARFGSAYPKTASDRCMRHAACDACRLLTPRVHASANKLDILSHVQTSRFPLRIATRSRHSTSIIPSPHNLLHFAHTRRAYPSEDHPHLWLPLPIVCLARDDDTTYTTTTHSPSPCGPPAPP